MFKHKEFTLALGNLVCEECGITFGKHSGLICPKDKTTETNIGVEKPKALDVQVGGNHYKDLRIQPVEYIHQNGIGFIEGSVIKYVTRWRAKGGIADLKKARHFLDLLIEMETRQ